MDSAHDRVNRWLARPEKEKQFESMVNIGQECYVADVREVIEELKARYNSCLGLLKVSREDNQKMLSMLFAATHDNRALKAMLKNMYDALDAPILETLDSACEVGAKQASGESP